MVRTMEGGVVTARGEAARHTALSLKFKDGELMVGVGDTPPTAIERETPRPAPPRPAPPKKKSKQAPPNPRQDDLFG
jgi:exodeoxyribonuclease VII large subunit